MRRLLVALLGLISANGVEPSRARQTPVQREVWSGVREYSISASANAYQQLMDLLSSEALHHYLLMMDDGSGLFNVAPEDLYQRMISELAVAEIVHNFGHENSLQNEGNCGLDVALTPSALGPNASYFYNQWELQSMGLVPVDSTNNVYADTCETQIFGFPAFEDLTAPDLATAVSRPVYGALNMYRASGGNPQCGPIAAVFSRTYVGDQAVIAPVDTGLFYATCDLNEDYPALYPDMMSNCDCSNCSAWPLLPTDSKPSVNSPDRALGTPGYLDHLIIPFLSKYNHTSTVAGEAYPAYNLARLLIRLLSRRTYSPPSIESTDHALWLNFIENTFGYLEINPVLNLPYSESVKMMVASFELLFGTSDGLVLANWCVERNWPLAWAHNPVDSLVVIGPPGPAINFTQGLSPVNVRLLDPTVLQQITHGSNSTTYEGFAEDLSFFNKAWAEASDHITGITNDTLRRAAYDTLWERLTYLDQSSLSTSYLNVEPLFADACASESCVGVRIKDSACVCP